MKKASKDSKGMNAHFVELDSMSDIARNVSVFGDTTRPIFSVKDKGQYMLMSPGIRVGGTRIVFTVLTKRNGSILSYTPAMGGASERIDIINSINPDMHNHNTQNIPIIELEENPFNTGKDDPKVVCVRAKDYSSMVKSIIGRSLENETIGKIYSFAGNGKRYIGSFNIIEEDDEEKVLCYAEIKEKEKFPFYCYDYKNDRLAPTSAFGEPTYYYVRVINLAKPFSFFKA
ncbi:MAG: hypothetical protein M1504_02500 [Candidatus Marsarchaeota archaeon]|nr:hypothetical protein [Candidatus Marsarchaeota archaeon]